MDVKTIKNQLTVLLKRWPGLYDLAKKNYVTLDHLRHVICGTKLEEHYWFRRHSANDWGRPGTDWIKSYWDSVNHPHRKFLAKIISKHKPKSILEIGCNCGPNLYLLAKKFPKVKIVGLDINPLAVQKGTEWFTKEGISNVNLVIGKADNLQRFKDEEFDVVFTDAVLIYIGPDKIRKVLKEFLRITNKALVLNEWHAPNSNLLGEYKDHWVRNYVALLKNFVAITKITVTKISEKLWSDKNWQNYGYVIEVCK